MVKTREERIETRSRGYLSWTGFRQQQTKYLAHGYEVFLPVGIRGVLYPLDMHDQIDRQEVGFQSTTNSPLWRSFISAFSCVSRVLVKTNAGLRQQPKNKFIRWDSDAVPITHCLRQWWIKPSWSFVFMQVNIMRPELLNENNDEPASSNLQWQVPTWLSKFMRLDYWLRMTLS